MPFSWDDFEADDSATAVADAPEINWDDFTADEGESYDTRNLASDVARSVANPMLLPAGYGEITPESESPFAEAIQTGHEVTARSLKGLEDQLHAAPEVGMLSRAASAVREKFSPILGPTEAQLMREGPERWEGVGIIPEASKPLVRIPRIPQQEGTVAQLAAGAVNTALGFGEFFESPLGLATAGAGAVGGQLLRRGIAGGFAADMASKVPEAARHAGQLSVTGTPQEQTEANLGLAAQVALPGLLAAHAIAPKRIAGRAPLSESEAEDLYQLQQAEKEGGLNPQEAQRLEQLKQRDQIVAEQPVEPLKPEHEEVLNEAAKELDVKNFNFEAKDGPLSGTMAGINRKTGEVFVNTAALNEVLDQMPDRAARKDYVESLLSEEQTHLATPDDVAKSFFDDATGAERFIARRRYTKTWSGKLHGEELSETAVGHEMLRAHIQRLSGMTPTEIAYSVGTGKGALTAKALVGIEHAIFATRKALGTKASKRQIGYLDEVANNIKAARTILSGGAQPQSPFYGEKEVEEMPPDELGKLGHGAGITEGITLPESEAPRLQEKYDTAKEEMKKAAAGGGGADFKAAFGKLNYYGGALMGVSRGKHAITGSNFEGFVKAEMGKLTDDGVAGNRRMFTPKEGPAANAQFSVPKDATPAEIVKKYVEHSKAWAEDSAPQSPRYGMSKRAQELAEQARRIREMQAKARGEELPEELRTKKTEPQFAPVAPEERVTAEASGAMPRITSHDLEGKAEATMAESRPDFSSFSDWAKRNMEGIKPEQLRDLWESKVWDGLLKADGPRLQQLRKSLGLESKYGARPITAVAEEGKLGLEGQTNDKVLARQNKLDAEAKQRYRNKVISAIARKLITESMGDRPELNRESINVDDVAFSNEKTKFGPYHEIGRDDMADPKRLEAILRDQARGSSVDPETASRRLVAVVDGQGHVSLLSTYNDAGVQRVTDPAGTALRNKPNRELNKAFIRQYRPFASILIKNPVRGLRQKFGSVSEFMDKMGKEASERSRIGEFEGVPEGAAPEDFEAEGTPGIEGEGGGFMGPKKGLIPSEGKHPAFKDPAELTAQEAGSVLDQLMDTVGNLESVEDVKTAISDLNELASNKGRSIYEIPRTRIPKLSENPTAAEKLARKEKIASVTRDILASKKQLTARDLTAINAYRKIFKKLEIDNPDASVKELTDRMAQKVFDLAQESKTGDDFARALVAELGVRTKPDIETHKSESLRELTKPNIRPPTSQKEFLGPFQRTEAPPEQVGAREPGAYIPESMAEERPIQTEAEHHKQREYQVTQDWAAAFRNKAAVGEAGRKKAMQIRGRIYRKQGVLPSKAEAAKLAGYEGPMSPFYGKKAGEFVSNAIKDTMSFYDEWMVDRMVRHGGEVAEQAGAVFRHIIDREKELYGSLTPLLDKARTLAGGTVQKKLIGQVPSKTQMKAVNWANELKPIKGAKFAATSNVVELFESKTPPPAYAQELVTAAKIVNLEVGKMIQKVIPGFKATGKFQRNINATGYDIIREGRGDMWRKWTAATAVANKMKLSEVRDWFRTFKETLDTPGVDSSAIEKLNQDFNRVLPKVVTHIKSMGQWQPVVHADLFNYLENTARRATHATAFREQFPNTVAGRLKLQDVKESVRNEMGAEGQDSLESMIRTMQGIPTDNYTSYGMLGPTRPAGQVFRYLNNTVGTLMSKMALTGQMIVQPGENIAGSIPVFLGYKNYLRGMGQLKQIYSQLEQQGAVNRAIYDFSYNKNSPVRSAFRMAGNTISKVFAEQALNELQEASAAATAFVVAERVRAGTLSKWEERMLPETFRAMGFDKTEVSAMMLGDVQLLQQFIRKASAFLTSGNRAISEGSALGANRLFNSVFRFQSYPMMKANQLRKVTGRLADAWIEGDAKDKKQATEMFSRFMFGNTLQGALTVGITTLLYGGIMGLKVKTKEALDDPALFLAEAFGSTISGPLYLAWNSMKYKGVAGFSDAGARIVFPYAVATEMLDMATGKGRYRDRDTFSRIGEFLKARTPATKTVGQGLAMVGLSHEDKKLDAALDGFYRWRRDTMGFDETRSFLKKDDRKELRIQMKKAVEALKSGDVDKFADAYQAASGERKMLGLKGKVSFTARRVLKNATGGPLTPDELDDLRKRIGNDAVDRLEYFDLMLKHAGNGEILPKDE